MITWIGLVGKILDFLLEKLLDKTVDWSLDKKKYACQSLVEFHDVLCTLEILLEDFLTTFRPLYEGEKTVIYDYWLRKHSQEIAISTEKFIRCIDEVGRVLYFYDPALTALIANIGESKGRFLSTSRSWAMIKFDIQWKTSSSGFDCVSYSIPSESLSKQELERAYSDCKKLPINNHRLKRSKRSWSNDTLFILLKDFLEQESFTKTDIEAVRDLYRRLSTHQKLIHESRLRLRTFISSQFSIEDLLTIARKSSFPQKYAKRSR